MKHNISYLFLRGLSRNQYHWKDRDTYEKVLNNKVYFLDLPGFGVNYKFSSPRTIAGITDNVKAQWEVMSGVDTQSKKVIVGLSLGGLVSLNWVSRYIEDWNGIVIMNSSLSNLSWPWERLMPRNYFSLLKHVLSSNPEKIENIVYDMTCNTEYERKELIADWVNIRKKFPYRKMDVFHQIKAASKFRSPPKFSIRIPGLVLTAPQDRMVSHKCSLEIAGKYGFDLKQSLYSGHDMSVDDGPWMLSKIKNFTDQL